MAQNWRQKQVASESTNRLMSYVQTYFPHPDNSPKEKRSVEELCYDIANDLVSKHGKETAKQILSKII